MAENDYVIRVLKSPLEVDAAQWNALLARQSSPGSVNPFMRHEYLAALHDSGSATPDTGWTPCFVTIWRGGALAAACALYLKSHSYGEYVFDHAWANAYQQHGLAYYPKGLVAVPFTPVPGARLLADNAAERLMLLQAAIVWCRQVKLSSLHLLFADEEDLSACEQAGLLLRHSVQFHWTNGAVAGSNGPAASSGLDRFDTFDKFLMSLSQDKRKKIRQERRKVADAGIRFRWSRGHAISNEDWNFFYECYERTYFEHGNAPYLTRDFFTRMQLSMPENWVLFVAEHDAPAGPDGNAAGRAEGPGQRERIACSLIAVSAPVQDAGLTENAAPTSGGAMPAGVDGAPTADVADTAVAAEPALVGQVAYGRYWGAVARVDCLHFEACYYQPIEWCITHGISRFEGGAQGEHKMARALLPVKTSSAHWLAHPGFAHAVEHFLTRECAGVDDYLNELQQRSPLRRGIADSSAMPAALPSSDD